MADKLSKKSPPEVTEDIGAKQTGKPEEARESSTYTISRRAIGDEPTEIDTLGFEPYVNAVTDFLTAKATEPPLTLSIEGEWGGGKSSFMQQLRVKLEGDGFQRSRKNKDRMNLTVAFNPWRHDKEDALWAAFALQFIEEISKQLRLWRRWRARFSLLWTRYNWHNGKLDVFKAVVLMATILLILITMTVVLFQFGIDWFIDFMQLEANSVDKTLAEWLSKIGFGGLWLTGLLSLLTKFKKYISNPLSFDLRKHMKSPDYVSRISFVENFHRDFKKIVNAYIGQNRAFVFIDDLDRCEVPKAADLMQAINLMISSDPRLFFIIGMDREKVAAGLAVKFEKAIPYLASGVALDEQSLKNRHGLEFGYSFIEKFIQIPFLVPQPRADKLEKLLGQKLNRPEKPQPVARGERRTVLEWLRSLFASTTREPATEKKKIFDRDANLTEKQRELRQKYRFIVGESDNETLGEIVSWVAPFLDVNPRRIKQFVNLFRLRVLIANETGLFDADNKGTTLTLEQLAKLVVITLRWPLFLRDIENYPELLKKVDSNAELEISDSQGPRAKRWGSRTALISLLKYGTDRDTVGDNYTLRYENVKKLMQASPQVRETEVRTKTPVHEEEEPESAEPIDLKQEAIVSGIKVRRIRKYKYQLAEDYVISISIKPKSGIITNFINLDTEGNLTVKKGYAWDGLAGPIKDTKENMRASMVLDALYQLMRNEQLSSSVYKKAADQEFKDICVADGVSNLQATTYYKALRKFGKPAGV